MKVLSDLLKPRGGISAFDDTTSKTLNYSSGQLDSVFYYQDAAKTILLRKVLLIRTGSLLTSVELRDASDVLLRTKTLAYTGSVLDGVTVT